MGNEVAAAAHLGGQSPYDPLLRPRGPLPLEFSLYKKGDARNIVFILKRKESSDTWYLSFVKNSSYQDIKCDFTEDIHHRRYTWKGMHAFSRVWFQLSPKVSWCTRRIELLLLV